MVTQTIRVIGDQDSVEDGAGAVVFWNLRGPTGYDELEQALEDFDLPADLMPNPTTPAAAMRAAEMDTRSRLPKGYFIRRQDKHTLVIVRETRGTDANVDEKYTPVLKVSQRNGQLQPLSVVKSTAAFDEEAVLAWVEVFRARMVQASAELSVHAMDWWIKKVMQETVHTVALGERGKPYYVPPGKMDLWTSIRNAVVYANTSHKFRQIPAMRGADCIDAVLEACLREVDRETSAIYKDLDAEDDNMLGARALGSRADRLDKLLGKMQSFESLLGPKLDDVREEIEVCKATVVEVRLTVQGEAE